MDAPRDFDSYEYTYAEAVERSIAFSHQSHAFFTRLKVERLFDLARRHVGALNGLKILDVGCGPGATDSMLLQHKAEVEGVDVSEGMVARARHVNPGARYRVYDGRRLPYADGAFDITFAICVLHHVKPRAWKPLVKEMARVTRPGGLNVVFEHNPYNPLTRRAVSNCPFDAGAILLSRRRSEALLRGAGLDVVERGYMVFVPFALKFSLLVDRRLCWLPMGAQHYVAAVTR